MSANFELSSFSGALADAVAAAEGSVVAVFGSRAEVMNGVVLAHDLVVASAHAVEREQHVEVATATGRREAALVGADPSSNLAVLRVAAELSPLEGVDSASLRVGELALAVSRGRRGVTARVGILAGVGPGYRLGGGARIDRYVESDIAPSPSLFGSALVSAQGKLVGVNSAGLVRGRLVTLPVESVRSIVDSIVLHGHVRRARLGVALERVELPRAVAERLERRHGLLVRSVSEGGPGEHAGLLLGDVLVALGSASLERVEDLQGLLDEGAIGRELTLSLVRAGAEVSLAVTPEAR